MTFILSLKSLFKREDAERRLQVQNGGYISVMLELPVELWIEILSFIPDQRTLARLMRVNHTFHDLAGRALYQTVAMKGDRAMALFNKSLELRPGREQSVTQLDVTELQFGHKHTFLSALSNLRHLTIMCSSPHGTWLRSCNYILAMRFPFLRGFTTNLPISTMDHLDTFLAAHDRLDELDLAHSHFVHDSGFEDFTPCPSKLFLTSIRILGYHSPFIDQKMPTPTSITHLYRPICSPVELHLIAGLRQLVSLRLGPNFGGWRAQWSPHTVTEIFPRLRFLQVDTIQGDVPELNRDVVDWTKSRGDVPRRPSSALRLTVAWTFSGALKSSLYSVAWADAWEDYLEAAALQVLRTWGDVVRRVIYRHTEIPTTTLTLRNSGNIYTTSVIDRREDHWKRV
ncbi:hypothetical protein GSI_00080 [Ganoderma sinense ZZ0214-1]|uniref:F-box domain-containing protein n=1 Tax=Ganoderma sinense ZZ0214-1 TaxID=1077348 RepID=A0A2G8SRM2_9APHY|nr:hypothetical protein GSI_00080 [Ganoderma sinense ZZ0214-1]